MTYDPYSPLVTTYHVLSFADPRVPAGYGRCADCLALVDIDGFLSTSCPGRPIDIVAEYRAKRLAAKWWDG